MHIYFSGIGGSGIGPLSLLAKGVGYEVSGSDKQSSLYTEYLISKGITDIHIGQTEADILAVHSKKPIDWLVYSSSVPIEDPNNPELWFAKAHGIKLTKRDDLINYIIEDKDLKLVAVAGTHGKTTTTAMIIWLMKELGLPVSYSVGAKLSFGEMAEYQDTSEYFIYEADEYDRNFLSFDPFMSVITGVTWDHPDIFPTKDEYQTAFKEFTYKSLVNVLWRSDIENAGLIPKEKDILLNDKALELSNIQLIGQVNRRNAWQVANAVHKLIDAPLEELVAMMDMFPGVSRRFEKLAMNIYTDYAHTAEKIKASISVALEVNPNLIVVYEGLHNNRQHFMLQNGQFDGLFDGVKYLYWVPSYLARENKDIEYMTPEKLIELAGISNKAEAAQLDDNLWQHIKDNQKENIILCLSAGGANSLDDWLRNKIKSQI